jgi:hypothetical protein
LPWTLRDRLRLAQQADERVVPDVVEQPAAGRAIPQVSLDGIDLVVGQLPQRKRLQ